MKSGFFFFFFKVGFVLAEEVIAANAPSGLKAFGSSHIALISLVGSFIRWPKITVEHLIVIYSPF